MSRVISYVSTVFLVLVLVIAGVGDSAAQCILANPSFELSGSGGPAFGGWNQFGVVGSSSNATHGAVAARLTGPNLGGWDVSGYWQRLDTAPGERWSASVRGWHSSPNPLAGQSEAILNIEWRNSSGNLISFESHTVADASTPLDEIQDFFVESGPAPSGTVATHFLLGVLQSPTDPPPDVFYDQATFDNLGPPTLDDLQWADFPGGRTITFSGRTWRVKGPGLFGPGPNLFCDTPSCTWVDANGRLHMTIQNISGSWYSTEVTLEESLGYGDYIFTTLGRLDDLHPNVVLGLFLWQYGPCFDPANGWWNPYNEIDVEFSRWGNGANDVGQFVAQPFDFPGNISRFDATFANEELTSHAFRWLEDRVEYRSWRGGPLHGSPGNLIHTWTYTGPHIPRPEQPRVHMNLWQFENPPNADQEVIVDRFTFIPVGTVVGIQEELPRNVTSLSMARPNPFNPSTTIAYTVMKRGHTEILIYDVSGRRVRTLVSRVSAVGTHEVVWDGRDDSGRRVASGVYLYRLRAGDVVDTKKMVLLK
ncbi:MAG: T9SS type A sorting domain-containing protein [Candidatus Krumholzibacteria bacterium]|nr:T9SS type A sorting domain-containing protein [Candidatus Krumholzibacteria bacterium]